MRSSLINVRPRAAFVGGKFAAQTLLLVRAPMGGSAVIVSSLKSWERGGNLVMSSMEMNPSFAISSTVSLYVASDPGRFSLSVRSPLKW